MSIGPEKHNPDAPHLLTQKPNSSIWSKSLGPQSNGGQIAGLIVVLAIGAWAIWKVNKVSQNMGESVHSTDAQLKAESVQRRELEEEAEKQRLLVSAPETCIAAVNRLAELMPRLKQAQENYDMCANKTDWKLERLAGFRCVARARQLLEIAACGDGWRKTVNNYLRLEVITVDASDLATVYAENELRGDRLYKDKRAKIFGRIDTVEAGLFGDSPHVSVTGVAQHAFRTIVCEFTEQERELLSHLRHNQKITLRGTIRGSTLGTVFVEDCEILK